MPSSDIKKLCRDPAMKSETPKWIYTRTVTIMNVYF